MSTMVQESVPFSAHYHSLLIWTLIGLVIVAAGFQLMRLESSKSRRKQTSSQDLVVHSSSNESSSADKNLDEPSDSAGIKDVPAGDNNNNWRCACEGGFLPPGLLKTFGGAEAVMRLGSGQCYHKRM